MSEWRDTEIGLIPKDWQVLTLDKISELLTDGSHLSPKESFEGKYMASVKDMRYGGFDFTSCKRISNDDYEKLKQANCYPQKGDILISKDGANCLDIIFVYNQEEEIVLLSSIAIVRLKYQQYYPSFYNYYLLSPVAQKIMRGWFISGSAIPRVVLKDFKKVPVPDLPFIEQKSIADVLSCLDAKIENLRSQNQTLEKIAQTLFNHWFIDFEFPNDSGKPYKSSGGAMVASELGDIPVGWRVRALGDVDVADISIGRTPPRKEKEWFSVDSKDIKWISIRDMGNCTTYIANTSEYLTKAAVKKFNIPVIPENTVILSFKLTVGRVTITTEKMLSNEAIAHIKLTNHDISPEYIYLHLKQYNFDNLGSTSSIATAVNSKSIKSIPLLLPERQVLSSFQDLANQIFAKLKLNTQQIQTLTKTRDTLLPKLMSGQIRITE